MSLDAALFVLCDHTAIAFVGAGAQKIEKSGDFWLFPKSATAPVFINNTEYHLIATAQPSSDLVMQRLNLHGFTTTESGVRCFQHTKFSSSFR